MTLNRSAPCSSAEVTKPARSEWPAKSRRGRYRGPDDRRTTNGHPGGIPGVQIRFAKADTAQALIRHRNLDHIGFDVNRRRRSGRAVGEPVRSHH
jgi:hypothetical protein